MITTNTNKLMKPLLPIILFGLLTLNFAHADTFISSKKANKVFVKGPARLTNVKAKKVMIDGCLAFTNLDVAGDVTVTCPIRGESKNLKCKNLSVAKSITAKNIKCDNMHIRGCAQLEDLEVSGNATISGGDVKIKGGKLQNLNLASDAIDLHNVNVNDITIESPRLASTNQSLYLKGKTLVAGTINFKSGQGNVFIEDNAKVNGEINGATVNNEKLSKIESYN